MGKEEKDYIGMQVEELEGFAYNLLNVCSYIRELRKENQVLQEENKRFCQQQKKELKSNRQMMNVIASNLLHVE